MRSRICYVVVLMSLCGVPVLAWSGANANMVCQGRDLPADLAQAEVLWEKRLGTHQYTIPTVEGERLYIGVNDLGLEHPAVKRTKGGILMCLDRTTGDMIWQLPIPRLVEGNTPPFHFGQWQSGLCSSPVIDGKVLYIVSPRGEVLCVDQQGQADGNDGPFMDEAAYMQVQTADYRLTEQDGDIVWRFDMLSGCDAVPHDTCASTVLLHGDYVYVCTGNGVDNTHDKVVHPEAPSLIVLDKKTGRLVARDGEKIGHRLFHGQWSSPALARAGGRELILLGAGDGILYAFEPITQAEPDVQTLRCVWRADCNPRYLRFDEQGEPLRYSGFRDKYPKGPSPIIGTPVEEGGRIYVTVGQSPICGPGEGALSCIDTATGRVLWVYRDIGRSLATVSISQGLLYVADFSGFVHCLDAETGRAFWTHRMDAGAWAASTMVADGKVYAADERNILWILAAGPEKRLLSRNRMDSAPVTCLAVEDVLYVPTQRSLIAYRTPR